MTETDPDLYDDLTGQVALVTGATRGIGRRVAADLLDLGATVYAGARDTDDVDIDADDGDGDSDLRPVELDVTDERAMVAAVDRIDDTAGRLDALVNNAGVMDTREPLDRMPTDAVDRTLDVNLRGPVLLTKHALPLLLDDGSHDRRDADGPPVPARVVNVTSGMGRISRMGGGSAAYRVSKTGLNGLTAYLDAEYGDEGLLANAVSPGWVATDMGGESAPRSVAEGADTIVWLTRFRDGPGGELWLDRERVAW